jgi:hypothetical protein
LSRKDLAVFLLLWLPFQAVDDVGLRLFAASVATFFAAAFGITAFSVATFSIATFSVATFGVAAFGVAAFSIVTVLSGFLGA